MSRFYDQFDDYGFHRITVDLTRRVRDKIATTGVVVLSNYRRRPVDISELLHALTGFGDNPLGLMGDDLLGEIYKSMNRTCNSIGAPLPAPGRGVSDIFRKTLRKQGICMLPEQGLFPIHDPVQALLSYIYAGAQGAPGTMMEKFHAPMSDMFGPKTFKEMKIVIENNPYSQIINDDNLAEPVKKEIKDGLPPVQTFLPKLLIALRNVNMAAKGKLDPLLKELSDKSKVEKHLTVSDRDLQKRVMTALESEVGKEIVFKTTGKHIKDIIYNTKLPATDEAILKVGDILIDKNRLNSMNYTEASMSLSPQVADTIFNEEKTKLNFDALVMLIEKLEKLDVTDAERKEINDRILTPLTMFLEPDDAVVDKIMSIS